MYCIHIEESAIFENSVGEQMNDIENFYNSIEHVRIYYNQNLASCNK